VFGYFNEKRLAEQQLQELKQKESANCYLLNFQRISAKLKWSKKALVAQFYTGLRNDVKDKISKKLQADNLNAFLWNAIFINRCLYKRQIEKGRKTGPYIANTERFCQSPSTAIR
jgi:hypothetical protein